MVNRQVANKISTNENPLRSFIALFICLLEFLHPGIEIDRQYRLTGALLAALNDDAFTHHRARHNFWDYRPAQFKFRSVRIINIHIGGDIEAIHRRGSKVDFSRRHTCQERSTWRTSTAQAY